VDKAFNYIRLTNFLKVLYNNKKDYTRLVVKVFSYEINTIHIIVYLLLVKLNCAINTTNTTLYTKSLSKGEVELLASFLSFYALVVQLGWVFYCRL
jgi:hypothetical protein